MKAIVILADGFEEIEGVAPVGLLRRAGVEVTVAGLSDLPARSARGVKIVCDVKLNQVRGEYDAIILPGGTIGAENLAASKELKALLIEMNRKGKLVCAICAAPALVLVPTGILDGKSVTGFPSYKGDFGKTTKYLDQKVVVDGNLITGQAAGSSIEFALAVVEKLTGKETGEKVRKAILA